MLWTFALDKRGAALVGGVRPGHGFVVARFTPNGLDRTFGRDGVAAAKLASPTWPEAIAVEPGGGILVAGGGEALSIVRFWGGYDRRRPEIGVRASCRGDKPMLVIAVRDRSSIVDLTVHIGSRVLRKTSAEQLRLAVPPRRRLAVRAVDGSGNARTRRVRAPGCD